MNTYQYNWLQNILQISDYDFIFNLLQIQTMFIKHLLQNPIGNYSNHEVMISLEN